jgi:A/G-specific adenine glycosylase
VLRLPAAALAGTLRPVTTVPRERLIRFQGTLLAWYRSNGRQLAWRHTRDPYRVLVSEVMAQQTQAARAEQAYLRFVERFPTVTDLAEATLSEVLTAWKGLGYNRRARALHQAAQSIVERHGGDVPADVDALLALPGVGPYTARAVLAFAFGQDIAPVDTNVGRVLTRALAGEPLTRRALQDLADVAVPRGRGREWSNALMDLGASLCPAANPSCHACPVAAACAWGGPEGGQGADPAAPATGGPPLSEPFAGSRRYHRGRLVDALRRGPVPTGRIAAAAQLEGAPDRLRLVVESLVADGLAEWEDGSLRLPDTTGGAMRARFADSGARPAGV